MRRSCLTPIPPTNSGHVWKKIEDGTINMWSLNADHHNGPRCIKCEKAFCHHCNDLYTEGSIPHCQG